MTDPTPPAGSYITIQPATLVCDGDTWRAVLCTADGKPWTTGLLYGAPALATVDAIEWARRSGLEYRLCT